MEVYRFPYTKLMYPSVDMGIITYSLWDIDEVVTTNNKTNQFGKYADNPLIVEQERTP